MQDTVVESKSKKSEKVNKNLPAKDAIKIKKKELKKLKADRTLKRIEKEKLKEIVQNAKAETEEVPAEVSTVSIAIPGSILDNAQSAELRTYLAGQIARAACIFQVDEIIVFDDKFSLRNKELELAPSNSRKSCLQLGRILQYLECPQYLRKLFFPIHKDLQYAGILNPLDAPHHLREQNNFMFREGVVTNKPVKQGRGSFVSVGLKQDVQIDKALTPGIRCTVKLETQDGGHKKLKGKVVAPSIPRRTTGVYWGYTVRIADCLSEVFSACPFKESYDLTIGTSDKGDPVNEMESQSFNHALIVFGGLEGLEAALDCDPKLDAEDPSLLFDCYLNTVPQQGTRTIRTEEAVLVTMTALTNKVTAKNPPINFLHAEEIAQSS